MAKTLKNMAQDFKNLEQFFRQLPKHVAKAYENFVKDNFEREAFLDNGLHKWGARAKKDRDRKGREKKKQRKLLVKSGNLRRSIRYRVSGNTITFFSDMPYAQVHNEGGKVQYTAKVKAHTRKTKKSGKVQVKAHTRQANYVMPKRQFMGYSKEFEEEIVEWIGEKIEKLDQ
jgi:phage gpG-like protein